MVATGAPDGRAEKWPRIENEPWLPTREGSCVIACERGDVAPMTIVSWLLGCRCRRTTRPGGGFGGQACAAGHTAIRDRTHTITRARHERRSGARGVSGNGHDSASHTPTRSSPHNDPRRARIKRNSTSRAGHMQPTPERRRATAGHGLLRRTNVSTPSMRAQNGHEERRPRSFIASEPLLATDVLSLCPQFFT